MNDIERLIRRHTIYRPTRAGRIGVSVFILLVIANIIHMITHPSPALTGTMSQPAASFTTFGIILGANVVFGVALYKMRMDTFAYWWMSVLYLCAFGIKWFK